MVGFPEPESLAPGRSRAGRQHLSEGSGHVPFTPRAKTALELSLRESLQLGHDHIGTEHILLGLIREAEGAAAQVLVRLGAHLDRVRQQVIWLLHGYQGTSPVTPAAGQPERGMAPDLLLIRIDAIESRLSAAEQWMGARPDTSDLDQQIDQARSDRHAATDADDFDQAASLRDRVWVAASGVGRRRGLVALSQSQAGRPR